MTPQDPGASASGLLAVSHGHQLYWETFGVARGIPLLVLHGGPGGTIRPYYRRLVEGTSCLAVSFEQRGCGRSRPFGDLVHNTTQLLVEDIEALRRHIGVERWVVVGGSWGSTLALAYAQCFPARVEGLVLSGIHLGDVTDRWWWWEGAGAIRPEPWLALRDALPEAERAELRANYLRRVLDPDPDIHCPAAMALMRYEAHLVDPEPDAVLLESLEGEPEATVNMGRLFAHYDRAESFLGPGALIEGAGSLARVPGWILNGSLDFCTPAWSAQMLHHAWTGSRLTLVAGAGHRWSDPPLLAAMQGAVSDAVATAALRRR